MPLLFHVEPAPLTTAVPDEGALMPIRPNADATWAPASIVSIAVPSEPTISSLLLVQVVPAPRTVAVLIEPARWPISAWPGWLGWPGVPLETRAPSLMVNVLA